MKESILLGPMKESNLVSKMLESDVSVFKESYLKIMTDGTRVQ